MFVRLYKDTGSATDFHENRLKESLLACLSVLLYLRELYTFGRSQRKTGSWCHSVDLLIYKRLKLLKNHRWGRLNIFFKKWEAIHIRGLPIEERNKHCFSLVIYGFYNNNTSNSANLSFIKFIFLLIPFDTRYCYGFRPSPHYGCRSGKGSDFSSFSQCTLIQISFARFISFVNFSKF